MTTFEKFLRARHRSKERGDLVKQFAAEKGISIPTAFRWLYKERHRLNANGELIRKPNFDKGLPRNYMAEQIAAVKKALKDPEKSMKQIADALAINRDFVRRVAAGRYDKKNSRLSSPVRKPSERE